MKSGHVDRQIKRQSCREIGQHTDKQKARLAEKAADIYTDRQVGYGLKSGHIGRKIDR